MRKRLVAFVIGVCSFLAVATPVSAGDRTPAPAPPESPSVHLCLDLLLIRLCP